MRALCGYCCWALVNQCAGRVRVLQGHGDQPRAPLPTCPVSQAGRVCIPSCTEIFPDLAALASLGAARVHWAAGQGGPQAATSHGGGDRAGPQAGHGGHVVKMAVDVPWLYEFDCALAIEYLESRWREGLPGWPPLLLACRGWKLKGSQIQLYPSTLHSS